MDDADNKTKGQLVHSSKPIIQSGSVSLTKKEQGPISSEVKSEISEIIRASEKEPEIPIEVREAGVEEVSDRLPLTDEHKAIGMEHAGESTQVDTQPKLPMSEIEALKIIKTTKNSYSRHWLAVLIEKIYKAVKNLK